MTEVIFYTRPGCSLCEKALAVVERVRERRPFALTTLDIERSEDLLREYLERIPVVTIDGVEAFQFFVDETEFEQRVAERQAA